MIRNREWRLTVLSHVVGLRVDFYSAPDYTFSLADSEDKTAPQAGDASARLLAANPQGSASETHSGVRRACWAALQKEHHDDGYVNGRWPQ